MMDITGAENYAEVALDIYTPNKRVSDELRELMPSSQDLIAEIRRHVPDGVELMPRTAKGRNVTLDGNPQRSYNREKFYVRVFLENEYLVGRSQDHIRRACFDGAKLVGERLAQRIAEVRERMHPVGGDFFDARHCGKETPLTVRFTAEPMNLLGNHRDGDSFACLDPVSDRVVMHFGSYFVICPPGEEVTDNV